ncbi:MAG: DUF2190 family protein [Eubacteriales bacterium]|nr:DUF2190 family protein [Eubacteriales bacterium]
MANAKQVLGRLTLVATGKVYKDRIVSLAGAHTANKAVGVAEYTREIGETVTLQCQGITNVISGAAVAAGALLTADSSGKAIAVNPAAIASGTVVEVLGVALDSASGADLEIRAFVSPHAISGLLDSGALTAETIEIEAGETITAGLIIGADGKHTANKAVGVAVNGGEAEAVIAVKVKGTVDIVSGAAFAVGDYLTSDASGKAVKYDPTNVNIGTVIGIVGVALEATTDADQEAKMLICPGTAVGTKALG